MGTGSWGHNPFSGLSPCPFPPLALPLEPGQLSGRCRGRTLGPNFCCSRCLTGHNVAAVLEGCACKKHMKCARTPGIAGRLNP